MAVPAHAQWKYVHVALSTHTKRSKTAFKLPRCHRWYPICKMIDLCTRQDQEWSIASYHLLPTCCDMLDVYQVCQWHTVTPSMLVDVSKMNCFSLSLQWKSVNSIIKISWTNVICYETCRRWQFYLTARQCTRALWAQHSPTAQRKILFPALWPPADHSWTSIID